MFEPVNRNPSSGDLRRFGWAMLGGFGAIGLVALGLAYRARPETGATIAPHVPTVAWVMWGLGIALWVLSRASTGATRAVYVGWMTATRPIGVVVAGVGLSVLFIVFLPWFAWLIRRQDPLRLRLKAGDESYWEDVKPFEPTLDRMARMF